MNKSIIVVDTPDSCLKCKFLNNFHTNSLRCKAIDFLKVKSPLIKWEELDKVADWCPLKKIPNKEQDCHGYNHGWNDLLDFIIKE